ncbi:phosphate propanoyltransferase [Megasphaera sp.]|jgi:putative phosphotransacetylase|uniref:phosphate propanoyltransferase n=1 Tax=Megasphaera sp. TaxID=2023260 RepID=UPI00267076E5|nr:phosphate propanoyltransferase [uncultured Megasphaera sp.]
MCQEMATILTEKILESVQHYENFRIPIGVSNRHVHVSRADLDRLYGKDYALTRKSELGQPGQFAANETVTLQGPKGTFEHVRILGPVRSQSQVEISKTDSFRLGVKAPIALSGHLQGTPGITLIGPRGTVDLPCGVIIAKRHIHMTPAQAAARHLKDGQIVDVETFGERRGILGDVIIRVSDTAGLEMHIDVDEANACSLSNHDYVMICSV